MQIRTSVCNSNSNSSSSSNNSNSTIIRNSSSSNRMRMVCGKAASEDPSMQDADRRLIFVPQGTATIAPLFITDQGSPLTTITVTTAIITIPARMTAAAAAAEVLLLL